MGYMGLQSLGYYAFLAWAPSLLRSAGISAVDAGILVAYSSLPGIIGAVTAPSVARRMRPTWISVLAVTVVSVLGLTGLLIAPAADGWVWVWMTLLGLGQGGAVSLALTYIVWRSPDTAHLSTVAQGGGYLIAGLDPTGIGVLHAVTQSWSVPVAVLIGVALVQLVSGIAASRERFILAC